MRIYDTAGILLSDNTVPGNGVLLAPDNVGVFVVVVDTDADSYVLKLIVR